MVARGFLALALLSSALFGAAAKNVMDDVTFDVVTRELDADYDSVDIDDADARRLQNGTMTTPTPTTPETVTGTLKFGGMTDAQATDFIGKASVMEAIKMALADKAGSAVSKSMVAVVLTKARRLQELADEVEPRALQATVTVNAAYTITLPAGTTASSITNTLAAVSNDAFKTAFLDALPTADKTFYTSIITVESVLDGTTTPAPTTPPTETDGAAKMPLTSSMFALVAAWLALSAQANGVTTTTAPSTTETDGAAKTALTSSVLALATAWLLSAQL